MWASRENLNYSKSCMVSALFGMKQREARWCLMALKVESISSQKANGGKQGGIIWEEQLKLGWVWPDHIQKWMQGVFCNVLRAWAIWASWDVNTNHLKIPSKIKFHTEDTASWEEKPNEAGQGQWNKAMGSPDKSGERTANLSQKVLSHSFAYFAKTTEEAVEVKLDLSWSFSDLSLLKV